MFVPTGREAAKWERDIRSVACTFSHTGEAPVLDGHAPAINHFVLGTSMDATVKACASRDDAVGDARALLVKQLAVGRSDASRGHFAKYYSDIGVGILFTVTQGDCAPDTIALHAGSPSVPSSWQAIRNEAASSMYNLRHTGWFRDSFKASQEFDATLPAPLCVPPPPCDGADDSGGRGTKRKAGDDPAESEHVPLEVQQQRAAISWAIAASAPLGARELSETTLDKYVAALPGADLQNILNCHLNATKIKPIGTRHLTPSKYASSLLSTRWAIGVRYKEFLGGLAHTTYISFSFLLL